MNRFHLKPLALAATLLAACPTWTVAADVPAAVQPASAGATPLSAITQQDGLPQVRHERYRLANGLEVILVEDHRLPLVAFNLWVHVGAANETPGLTGFAHLFEHLMFAGSRHIPRGQMDRIIDQAGGTDSNGSTTFDRTNYYFTLPSNQLELGLWLKSDMLGYMIDEIDAVSLANQQDVVRNERRQNTENRPYGVVDEAMFAELFPQGHPYRGMVIGSHADIQAAQLKDVKAFYKTYYRPNNASLVLVGDFKPAEAKALVEKYFGPLQAGPAVPKIQVTQPVITQEKRKVVTDDVKLARVTMAWHTPAQFAKDDAELDVAAVVLGQGANSRLHRALVVEQELAQEVMAAQESAMLGSVFQIEAVAKPGVKPEVLEAAIQKELDRFFQEGPTARELEAMRISYEKIQYERLQKYQMVADTLNLYQFAKGDPGFLPADLGRYRQVTPASVQSAAQRFLGAQQRVVIHALPGQKVLAPEVATPPAPKANPAEREHLNVAAQWRQAQPKAKGQLDIQLPQGDRFTLSNGMTVIHVDQPGVPLVAAQLVFPHGSAADPAGKAGLALLTSRLLAEGTVRLDNKAFAEALDEQGADLSPTAGTSSTAVSLSSLSRRFEASLGLLAEAVRSPGFREADVKRGVESLKATVQQQGENPVVQSGVLARRFWYGQDNARALPGIGTEASLQAITQQDVQQFWQTWMRPGKAALVVVGDIRKDRLKALAEQHFGSWKEEGAAPEMLLKPAQPAKTRVVFLDKPGSPQTGLSIFGEGLRTGDEREAVADVANAALGGNFTSRINHLLREVRGFTYGAYSRWADSKVDGLWALQGGIRSDATGQAVQDIFDQVKGFRAKPVSAPELLSARNSQLLAMPGHVDNLPALAGQVGAVWLNGQPADQMQRLARELGQVDAKAVHGFARSQFDPNRLLVVLVGDRKVVMPQLRKVKALKGVDLLEVDATGVVKQQGKL